MTKVTADKVKEIMDGGAHLAVVDARAATAWDEAETKAAGAVRIPPDEAERHLSDLNQDDFIVIYCT